MRKKGFLITLAAPSGGGKSSVCDIVLRQLPQIRYSISWTTREPRGEEKNGIHYFFTDEQTFLQKKEAGFFLESALVHGHYYGTSKEFVYDTLQQGSHIIMDIDVQGVEQIRKQGFSVVTIFIIPPTYKILEERLLNRKTDSEEVIRQRLINAKKEIDRLIEYDYLVINKNLEEAARDIVSIINAEEIKVSRYENIIQDFYEK